MKKTPNPNPEITASTGPRTERGRTVVPSMLTRQMAVRQTSTPISTDGASRSPCSSPTATGSSAEISAATGATTLIGPRASAL